MRAWVQEGFEGLHSLRCVDLPDPRPAPGEVLVAMRAVALNYRDLVIMRGQYGPWVRLPLIVGCDGAGEVVAVGPGVQRWQPGDRVIPCLSVRWITGPPREEHAWHVLGSTLNGTFAELGVFPEESLVRIPDHLSWEEAATLPCAGVTAWNALIVSGKLRPGETVLTMGTGGVSTFAVKFAKLAGARVIAISSSHEKLARLKALGVADGLNYQEVPEWGKAVRELTHGEGVDHVLELGGAGTMEQSTRAVRVGGVISLIGVLAPRGEFNLTRVLMKSIRVQGIFGGSREMLESMARAMALARLRPVVDRVFPFEGVPQAYEYFAAQRHFGKVVVRVV